ncbi:MAG TPA: OmpA family protein [Deltaproteobacteria bacterium]|nr:OmpA family protein [Deltaproteobacteria bacterium]
MKRLMKVFIVIALLVFSTTAFAQIRPGTFNIGPYFGLGAFEGNQDLDNAPVIGIRAGYDFTKNWGVEATVNWIPTRYNYRSIIGYETFYFGQTSVDIPIYGGKDDSHVNVYNYRIEGIYNFDLFPDKRFVPFLAVGVGGQTIDYRGTHHNARDTTRFAPDWGGGLKFFMTENMAIRADVRHVIAIGSAYNDLEATLGLAFYFGGKKDAAKQVFDEKVRLNVEFDFDKADIRPRYHDELKKVGDFMNQYPDVNMALEGHTDSIGTDEYNQRLSERRVESVKNYIVDKFNIDGKRIEATGYGESRPIADNSTDEGRQRNRRVEAVTIK